MKTENIKINNAILKTYIWEDSTELKISKRPGVLVFPGGSYMMCSDREAEPIALAYVAEGYNAFVLRYTTKEGFEKPFEEAQEALSVIRKNAKKWNVFSDKIAVCGFSAGGHLATAMGAMAKDKPNAMILGYPAVLGENWKKLGNPVIPDIVKNIKKDAAPTFIFSSFEDIVVPVENTLAIIGQLNKYNVPFECHIFQKGIHGFSLAKKITESGNKAFTSRTLESWFPLSVQWLKDLFGDFEEN